MLSVLVLVQAALVRRRCRHDRGQTTAEYALVLLGAAAVALVLVAWATKSGKLTQLFDAVIDQVLSKF
jgi:Flp pilus assembly pilin Flp